MSKKYIPCVDIYNAKLIFRNFRGLEKRFNKAGSRNFCVILDDEMAARLEAEGWRVKYLPPLEEGDTPKPYLKVKVCYGTKVDPNGVPKKYGPDVFLITGANKTLQTEDTVGALDTADIVNARIRIWPGEYEGKYTAYLNKAYIETKVDEFDLFMEEGDEMDLNIPEGIPFN